MGFETILVAGVIGLIIIGIFAPGMINDFFSAIDKANGFFTATQLTPRVNVDETVCDLRVKVFAKVTQDFGIAAPEITIDKDNNSSYEWFECESSSKINALYLLDWDLELQNTSKLDFISLGGESISVEIVLRDQKDSTQKVDAFTQPQMKRLIQIEQGIIKTPLDASMEFVVKNIPERNYDLEIYYGRAINDMDAGKPFISKICNLNTSPGTC